MYLAPEIIKKKRSGEALTKDEIQWVIQSYSQGALPDYQMSALLMAIFFKGMTKRETLDLTQSMLHSGVTVDLSHIESFKVDKHSTGGVGDKTSLILGPIVAAAGLSVPMISGRGLGHTGGTLDKLESIPGFNTQLSLEKFKDLVAKNGISFIGQTLEICPADKKIYALRDVTATIECLPLICASILSKKLAEGIDGIVFDVKFGNGAFMKSLEQASELAHSLVEIARYGNKRAVALLTNMSQPLGRYSGNALEVTECVEIMQGKTCLNKNGLDLYADTRELSLCLSAQMLLLSGRWKTYEDCYALALEMLESGKALTVFEKLCVSHGGNLAELPKAKAFFEIKAESDGFIASFDTEAIGTQGIHLKAGRQIMSDLIEPTSGVETHFKVGEPVRIGDVLFTLFGNNLSLLEKVGQNMLSLVQISQKPTEKPELIKLII